MLFSSHPKQMALMAVLSACCVSSCALASGDGVSALDEGEVTEKAISLRAAPSVSEEQLSAPSPLASIFSSGTHKEIYRTIVRDFDWKSLFQLRGVSKGFQSQIVVLDKNATPEAIEKAKLASFVAVICKDRSTVEEVPENLKKTLSWSNLLVLEGAFNPEIFETLSSGLRMLSLKAHMIYSDKAMGSLQTWLDRTTHLESLNLPYCLVGPTVYGISQSATGPKATEAATFVSHLPQTLRHLNLSGNSHMGGHEIVNSLLRALSQSSVPLTSLNLEGRSTMDPEALPSSLTSLAMNVPFYMFADSVEPLQLPQGLRQLSLTSDVYNYLKNVLNYIPEGNAIEALEVKVSDSNDLDALLDGLQKLPSLRQVKIRGFGFSYLRGKSTDLFPQKLARTQLVSVDLRQCLSLSQEYKDKFGSSPSYNRMGEKIEIKL